MKTPNIAIKKIIKPVIVVAGFAVMIVYAGGFLHDKVPPDSLNVLPGDTLNGVAVTTGTVTITVASGSTVPSSLTFDPAAGSNDPNFVAAPLNANSANALAAKADAARYSAPVFIGSDSDADAAKLRG